MSLYVERIPNRTSPPAILLRKSWRQDGKVKRITLANLSRLPDPLIEDIRRLLKGARLAAEPGQAFEIRRALPHGHVVATLGLAQALGLRRILHRHPGRHRDLALAAIVARLLDPTSKLATARSLSPETASSSLGAALGLGAVTGNEMLAMLDWLSDRQLHIERSLANRHLLGANTLVLHDVSTCCLEGQCCPLAAFGHNRDGKKAKKQITFGLLCAGDGCPVAVEVFPGNAGDPTTLAAQVEKIRTRFGIRRVALVGDRGMITTARIRADLEPATLDWISALKTVDIRKLLKPLEINGTNPEAPLQPEQLIPDAVAEIASPDFPGERLMVCLNPRLRAERARRRQELLAATEAILEQIAGHIRSRRLRGRDRINRRVGREANRRKVEKHFDMTVTDDDLTWSRNERKITEEARLDGIHVVRTSLDAASISADDIVEACKSLSQVKRAFRSLKTTQFKLRPIHVNRERHVRAHVFLCMLAWYVEWHLRQRLAPLLFEDHDRTSAQASRTSPVPKARDSAGASSKRTDDGLPVHSLHTMLADLATLTLNEITVQGRPDQPFPVIATPTKLQAEMFRLLGIAPSEIDSSRVTG